MIGALGIESRDLWISGAGFAVLAVYISLRLLGRDLVSRGPSPKTDCLPLEAVLLIVVMFFLQMFLSSVGKQLKIEPPSRRALFAFAAPLAVCLFAYLSYIRPQSPVREPIATRLLGYGRGLLTGALFWLGTAPVVYSVYLGWLWLYQAMGGVPEEQNILKVLQADPLAFFLTALVFAPLAEEVLFRGVLFPSLKRLGGLVPAVVLSSVMFALPHASLTVGPALFVMGVFLALAYEWTGTLWAPIGFHAAFNAWTFLGKLA